MSYSTSFSISVSPSVSFSQIQKKRKCSHFSDVSSSILKNGHMNGCTLAHVKWPMSVGSTTESWCVFRALPVGYCGNYTTSRQSIKNLKIFVTFLLELCSDEKVAQKVTGAIIKVIDQLIDVIC